MAQGCFPFHLLPAARSAGQPLSPALPATSFIPHAKPMPGRQAAALSPLCFSCPDPCRSCGFGTRPATVRPELSTPLASRNLASIRHDSYLFARAT